MSSQTTPSEKAEIEMRGVWKSFSGRAVLRNLNLVIPRGGLTFLVGRSGMGKSVLSRCAVGLLRADAGEIIFDGRDISSLSEHELLRIRSRIPYVIQESALVDWLSIRDNVMLALTRSVEAKFTEARAAKEAEKALDDVGILDAASARPPELSSGDKKLAAIARAIVLRPQAIFYDEPTTGLDPSSARRVDEMIRRLCDGGTTSVVVSHDLESIRRIADHVALLDEGIIACCCSPENFFQARDSNPAVRRFFHQTEV